MEPENHICTGNNYPLGVKTPCSICNQRKFHRLEERLFGVGAKAGSKIHRYNYGLLNAAFQNNLSRVKMLLQLGADIHHTEEIVLRDCAEFGFEEIVRCALAYNADARVANGEAVRRCLANGHDAIAKLLIDHGAHRPWRQDILINRQGETL